MKIKFTCQTIKWSDGATGYTYHSNRITRCRDGKVIVTPFTYGYGDHYRHTAIQTMAEQRFIPKKYKGNEGLYERENNYPIQWIVSNRPQRECIANGTL